eukprot:s443_g46.t1
MTSLRALGLEVPSKRLLEIHGDLIRQQPPLVLPRHGRGPVAAPAQVAAPAPQPDQALVDRPEDHGGPGSAEVEPMESDAEDDQLPLLDAQSPKHDGEAMKDSERSGESGPSERAN